uniref:Uncharacterized protein n=1 Tax=Anopheles atroparvus TaxID=41427 RepID=A0A182J1Y1_ANOAO
MIISIRGRIFCRLKDAGGWESLGHSGLPVPALSSVPSSGTTWEVLSTDGHPSLNELVLPASGAFMQGLLPKTATNHPFGNLFPPYPFKEKPLPTSTELLTHHLQLQLAFRGKDLPGAEPKMHSFFTALWHLPMCQSRDSLTVSDGFQKSMPLPSTGVPGAPPPTGAPTICQQVVSHEAALALASSHGALCNYANVTTAPYGGYDLAGSLLSASVLPPGSAGTVGTAGPLPATALITIETSPGLVLAGQPSLSGATNTGAAIEWHQQQQQQQQHSHACGHRPEPLPASVSFLPTISAADTSDFVGVGTLDILKGVGQDSIIGIRSKALEVNDGRKVVTVIESSSQLAASSGTTPAPVLSGSLPRTGKAISATMTMTTTTTTTTATATTSTTTPAPTTSGTPGSQVSLLPYYSDQHPPSGQPPGSHHKPAPPMPPTITVTSTDDPGRIDGMLDRISHDLDYLLNRTGDNGSSVVPIQLRPATGGSGGTGGPPAAPTLAPAPAPAPGSISAPLIPTCHSVHEVIIEESEEVDS